MIGLRILLGVLKGAIVGGLLGGALWFFETGGDLGNDEASWAWLRWPLYGAIGLLTGLVSGRPPWAKGYVWVSSLLKGVFGFGVGVGLYFLGNYLLQSFEPFGRLATEWYFGFGAAVGVIYAVFIEIDDSVGKRNEEKKSEAKPAKDAAKSDAITPAKE